MTKTKTNTTKVEAAKAPTKLAGLIELLRRPEGAELPEMMSATGWQAHSVRGAIAGSIKCKGWKVESEKVEGRRVYKIAGQIAA